MDGGISGLNWPAALAGLPRGLDRDFAKRLLAAAETAYVAAWWAYAEAQQQKPKRD
ncbi:hypothetical protein [Hyphomicrobium sp.]|uniref:hypothetical protein n=1 Tax=Hyphomicrobium sp. TaxID=82 RepID=UPI0025BC3229|nr:hypothetical protein [Hyphomicrobium sp.]